MFSVGQTSSSFVHSFIHLSIKSSLSAIKCQVSFQGTRNTRKNKNRPYLEDVHLQLGKVKIVRFGTMEEKYNSESGKWKKMEVFLHRDTLEMGIESWVTLTKQR